MKIGILGAGSWGTALTVLLSDNGHDITVWSVDEKEIEMLDTKREHLTKLPGVKLPDSVRFTTDEQEVCKDAELLVMVVPSPFIRSTAKRVAPYITEAQTIVNVSKGIEDESLKTLSARLASYPVQATQRKLESVCRQPWLPVRRMRRPRL